MYIVLQLSSDVAAKHRLFGQPSDTFNFALELLKEVRSHKPYICWRLWLGYERFNEAARVDSEFWGRKVNIFLLYAPPPF